MSISYEQLKSGLFSDHDLVDLIQNFNLENTETGWTIVKYVVRNGDTVKALSQRFQIPTMLILRLNALSPGATLKQGQVILLPEPCV
ncbi:MAG TPA: LysM peptidoglycan-binding domain-containing protein [Firmicutes bacterium]|jgi:LysM repeat protein|nr:LysM peptidoglycan-binding domain-containing protein [Bacillota bacterium]